jgi:mono/diheme cytochrome c family protein
MSERRTGGHAATRTGARTHRGTGAPGHRRAGAPTSLPRAAACFATLALALGAGACTTLDKAVGTVPWFTTMRDQPSIRPFEMPRTPPVGSVPTTGREDSLDLLLDLKDVLNPLPDSWESQRRGKQVYEQYCIVCHGPAAHGDGTVVPKFVPPPDLTLEPSRQRGDGYLFAMIRQGRGIMPRYGDKVRGLDRWAVVNYLRQLLGLVAQPSAPSPAPAPGAAR